MRLHPARAAGMIRAPWTPGWARDELWRRARAVPSLDLWFADSKSLVDATTGQNLVTFTRASEATFVNSQGQIQTAAINAPRFDHNPTTGESLGLLVEEQRQNLLLNSGTLSTQNVTVTAVAHTLSFTGTGTITLSGTSTAGPLVGTGTGEANRVSLTFTPTAGTLTLTVSGTVTNAQLEIGAFRTSYIPTAGTAATRSADVASISGSNFSSWYRQDEGTVFVNYIGVNNITGGTRRVVEIGTSGATGDRMILGYNSTANSRFLVVTGGATQADINPLATQGALIKAAAGFAGNNFQQGVNGALGSADTSGTVPTVSALAIGADFPLAAGTALNGHLRRLTFWPTRLGNEVLQRITQ